uniref:Leucine rich repeat containing 36 n=1 Tax=Pelusios castaneus TaxID=367368 RepID=A0A8C8S0R5_9SAUR
MVHPHLEYSMQFLLVHLKNTLEIEKAQRRNKYNSLPSPSQMRSSLRSPEKIRAGLTRGGFRVTFSDSKSIDSSLEREIIGKPSLYYLNQDISSTKKLDMSDTNKTNPYKLCRDTSLDSFDHLYLSSTLQNKDLKRLQKDKRSTNFRDCSVSLAHETKTISQSASGDLLITRTEMDNSTQGLLKLSSDLSTSTHLNSDPVLLANRFSTLSSRFSDLTSRHQPSSAETLLENSQPATMRKTSSAMPRKDSESAANRCLSPSRMRYKQSDRLHSSPSPQHCFKESNKESVPGDPSNDTSIRESQSPKRTEKTSHIAAVLQQLLELVDYYWDGAGSLLLNKNFLSKLFHFNLNEPPLNSVDIGSDSGKIFNYSESVLILQTFILFSQILDLVEQQQAKGLEESHVSSSRLQKMDCAAASNSNFSGSHSLTYEELLRKNELLNVQVESLTLELKQYKKLQETVNLLQESQRYDEWLEVLHNTEAKSTRKLGQQRHVNGRDFPMGVGTPPPREAVAMGFSCTYSHGRGPPISIGDIFTEAVQLCCCCVLSVDLPGLFLQKKPLA